MLAADPLSAAGIPFEEIRRRLPGVDPVRIPIRVAPWWLRVLWVGNVGAMATPRSILVGESPLAGPIERWSGLVLHELAHVDQWRRLGVAGFLTRYLTEYLGNRLRGMGHDDAYHGISLEREAEEVRQALGG